MDNLMFLGTLIIRNIILNAEITRKFFTIV